MMHSILSKQILFGQNNNTEIINQIITEWPKVLNIMLIKFCLENKIWFLLPHCKLHKRTYDLSSN